jgi:hypothetical protein
MNKVGLLIVEAVTVVCSCFWKPRVIWGKRWGCEKQTCSDCQHKEDFRLLALTEKQEEMK